MYLEQTVFAWEFGRKRGVFDDISMIAVPTVRLYLSIRVPSRSLPLCRILRRTSALRCPCCKEISHSTTSDMDSVVERGSAMAFTPCVHGEDTWCQFGQLRYSTRRYHGQTHTTSYAHLLDIHAQ